MESSKVVVFRCGQEDYAISVDQIVSIEKVDHINPVPHLPHYVVGLTKNRGELLPVLDFEQILYNRSAGFNDTRLVIVQADDFLFALQVVEAKEIMDLPNEVLKQVGLINYARTKYFTAVANLEDRMITVVSPTVLCDTLDGIKDIKQYMIELEKQKAEEA
ncbi:chemotaxis protein CheW [Kurthia massiliensis]|uniref:chemotaxis protein CheW n=1 Tax=Kurthia massiliensis TaxID=1033739 RepID=UPI0002891598|nr:chemotaxis protein CheW [Kurthia massiliensis]